MSKQASMRNGSIMSWFKPKANSASQTVEPPAKRPRITDDEKWPSSSPTPPPTTLPGSAEQPRAPKAKVADINASFSSVHSTSSKRMTTSSGQEVVRGSDTETDEDLEDLDTILNKSRPKSKPATTTTNDSRTTRPISFRSAPKKPKQKDYGPFSLSRLVEANQRQTAMEVRIAEAQANLHEATTEASTLQGSPKKDAIKAVLIEGNDKQDGGKARRVLDALERTEAFERNDVWHFFEPKPAAPSRNPFPNISHPMLQNMLNDPERRRQALASGYLQRIAHKVPLPDELLVWMMTEVCTEPKDNLLEAYIETLHHGASSTSSCLTPQNMLRCFRILGAKSGALDFQGPIQHSRETSKTHAHPISSNLSPFVDLLSRICGSLPLVSKDYAIHFLVRACFDHTVLSSDNLGLRIETCLGDILKSYAAGPELNEAFSRITNTIFDSMKSPTLRQQLIAALPRSTFLTHNFRRRLALAFSLDKARHLDASLENPALTARMLLLFERGSTLRITPETDYVELKARLSMLNVALDAGFSNFDFLEDENKPVEKQFNEKNDSLTNAVRDLTARIVDAGAAHMSRTEAKVMAEILAQRLEFQVRTREKPPRDWFGEQERREKEEFMRGYFVKKEKENSDAKNEPPKIESAQPVIEDGLKVRGGRSTAHAEQANAEDTATFAKWEQKTQSTTSAMVERQMAIRNPTASPPTKKKKKKGKSNMLMIQFP